MITVRVAQTIKGPPAATVQFAALSWGNQQWKKAGECVFVLKYTARAAAGWAPSPESNALIAACPLVMRNPLGWAPMPTAASHPWPVYDSDLRPIESPGEIIHALQQAVQNPPPPNSGHVELMVAPTTPNVRVGAPGGLHFANVVLDARAEERARRWLTSSSEYDRWNACKVLGRIPTPANVALLTHLLDDPFLAAPPWPSRDADEEYGRCHGVRMLGPYPVRRAAYAALLEWEAAPSHAILFEPKYPHIYLWPRTIVIILCGILSTFVGVVWLKRRRWTGRLGWFTLVSLLLFLLTAALWLRGGWRIDEVAWHSPNGSRHGVVLSGGLIRLVHNPVYEPDPAPPAFTTQSRTFAIDADWALPPYTGAVVIRQEWLGFATERLANSDRRVYAWFVPLWAICLAFGILPSMAAVAWMRRRQRRSTGRCVECGYDLRASSQRCPECGAEFLSKAVS